MTVFVITSVDNATCAWEKMIPLLLVMTKKIERVPRRLVPGSCAIQVPVDFRHRAKQKAAQLMASRNVLPK